jgi:DNA repair photolyase
MSKYNSDNLYLRYGYRLHMREALGLDEKTIHQAVAAIAEFDAFNAYRDYLDLGEKDAMRFKEWLIQRPNKSGGKRLARSTVVHRLGHIQAYLRWVKTRTANGGLRAVRAGVRHQTKRVGGVPTLIHILR